jgi:tetratricopeptide (TPR) repeat protein
LNTIEEELKRASSYKEAGQLDRAKSLLQSLLNQAPDDWRIWNEMGHCFIKESDYTDAHDAFENAIQLKPELTGLWNNKGYALKEMGDLSGAIDATHRAKSYAKNPQDTQMAHYNLACYLSLSGKPEQALKHLAKACVDNPQIQEWAKEDTDLDPIRKDPRFADTIG